jgi:hypothetical protein
MSTMQNQTQAATAKWQPRPAKPETIARWQHERITEQRNDYAQRAARSFEIAAKYVSKGSDELTLQVAGDFWQSGFNALSNLPQVDIRYSELAAQCNSLQNQVVLA